MANEDVFFREDGAFQSGLRWAGPVWLAEMSGVLSFGSPLSRFWADSFFASVCSGFSFSAAASCPMGRMSDAETFSFGIRAAGLGVTAAMRPVADGFSSESAMGRMSCASEG